MGVASQGNMAGATNNAALSNRSGQNSARRQYQGNVSQRLNTMLQNIPQNEYYKRVPPMDMENNTLRQSLNLIKMATNGNTRRMPPQGYMPNGGGMGQPEMMKRSFQPVPSTDQNMGYFNQPRMQQTSQSFHSQQTLPNYQQPNEQQINDSPDFVRHNRQSSVSQNMQPLNTESATAADSAQLSSRGQTDGGMMDTEQPPPVESTKVETKEVKVPSFDDQPLPTQSNKPEVVEIEVKPAKTQKERPIVNMNPAPVQVNLNDPNYVNIDDLPIKSKVSNFNELLEKELEKDDSKLLF